MELTPMQQRDIIVFLIGAMFGTVTMAASVALDLVWWL